MIRRQTKGSDVRVTFVIPDAGAVGKVSVVGDFNGWTPGRHTLVRRANGTRSVALTLEPGSTHRFRYLGEGGQWFDDPEADALTHEGGVLHV
ncbi:MAG: isoamylase early set domain-containing protein [Kineosporiaceae bacterium]